MKKMEKVIEKGNDGQMRFFESENYYQKRTFFENGIVDGGYNSINFDFSDCEFENNTFGHDPSEIVFGSEDCDILDDVVEYDIIEME